MGSGFADAPRGAEHPARAFEARTLSPVSLSPAEGSRRGTPVRLRLWREPHDPCPRPTVPGRTARAREPDDSRIDDDGQRTWISSPRGTRTDFEPNTPSLARVTVPSSLASRDTMHSARRTSARTASYTPLTRVCLHYGDNRNATTSVRLRRPSTVPVAALHHHWIFARPEARAPSTTRPRVSAPRARVRARGTAAAPG